MTTCTIYPLFGSTINMNNMIKYATVNSLTIVSYEGGHQNSDGTYSAVIIVSQILTAGQQTAIQNIFNGQAFIVFT